jgi:hypothetical protein
MTYYVLTSTEGDFDFGDLLPGEYLVWTCLDGFDEIRFELSLEHEAPHSRVDLYLGPSEALGKRDVVTGDDESRARVESQPR